MGNCSVKNNLRNYYTLSMIFIPKPILSNLSFSEILPIVQDGRSFVGSPSDSVWTLYSDGHWNEESCHVTPQSCGIVGNNSLNIEVHVYSILSMC